MERSDVRKRRSTPPTVEVVEIPRDLLVELREMLGFHKTNNAFVCRCNVLAWDVVGHLDND